MFCWMLSDGCSLWIYDVGELLLVMIMKEEQKCDRVG